MSGRTSNLAGKALSMADLVQIVDRREEAALIQRRVRTLSYSS